MKLIDVHTSFALDDICIFYCGDWMIFNINLNIKSINVTLNFNLIQWISRQFDRFDIKTGDLINKILSRSHRACVIIKHANEASGYFYCGYFERK